MPTYDYQCSNCHSPFEAHHAIEAPTPPCPFCGGASQKVILSAPAMHGQMAQGRELAMRSIEPKAGAVPHQHGPGCACCQHHSA